jgi:hypothetical protein
MTKDGTLAMTSISRLVLAVALIIGLSLAVAGRGGGGQTVHTVPQLQAALPGLHGGTVLVRGVLLFIRCMVGMGVVCPSDEVYMPTSGKTHVPYLPVVLGPENPLLVPLRRAHVIAPYIPSTLTTRTYLAQILSHPALPCAGVGPCPRVILLDTLR